MGAVSPFKHVSLLPMSAAAAAVVILLGTMMGQAGHDEGSAALIDSNPMAGMNMPGMDGGGAAASAPAAGMDMSGKDAGMDMSGKSAGMDMSGKDAGMDMTGKSAGMDMTGKDAGMDMSAAGMNMSAKDHAAMAKAPMAMKPGMAAQMAGGVHADCASATTCSVIFAKGASGSASLLGFKTRLAGLSAKSARLTVGGHEVVLQGRKAVRYHGLTFKVTRISAKEVWISVVKTG